MERPISGNPAQRKSQVQSIANDVMGPDLEDNDEAEEQDEDNLEVGNHPAQSAQVPQIHTHTTHDHATGHSTTHSVPHGQDCPSCGPEYMGASHGSHK